MSASTYNFYNKSFWSEKSSGKGYLPWESFKDGGDDKVGGIIGANASSMAFTIKLTDKVKGPVWKENNTRGKNKIWSTYNIGQQNPNTKEIYLMAEDIRAVDNDTPLDETEKDINLIYNQTEYGQNESYIIDLFSLYSIFKGDIQVDFYSENPFSFSEQQQSQYLVWQWKGKTESNLTNSLRNWCTNYKTSFLLPHDYEIPTFNYPNYIIPPSSFKFDDYKVPDEDKLITTNSFVNIKPNSILINGINEKDADKPQSFNNNFIKQVLEIKFNDIPNGQYLTSWELFLNAFKTFRFKETSLGKSKVFNIVQSFNGFGHVEFKTITSSGINNINWDFTSSLQSTKSFIYNINLENVPIDTWGEMFIIDLEEKTTNDAKSFSVVQKTIKPKITIMAYHTNNSLYIGIRGEGKTNLKFKGTSAGNTTYSEINWTADLKIGVNFTNMWLIARN